MILKRFESLEKTDNGYLIHGDCADVMVEIGRAHV